MVRTNFRNPKAVPVAALIFCLAALYAGSYFREQSDFWLMLFSVSFGVLASLETWTTHIYLGEHSIQVCSNFKRTEIRREEISKVTWESGSSVSIQLQDGDWVQMPEMFQNSQGLSKSLRAWVLR